MKGKNRPYDLGLTLCIKHTNVTDTTISLFDFEKSLADGVSNFGFPQGVTVTPFHGVEYNQLLKDMQFHQDDDSQCFNVAKIRIQNVKDASQVTQPIVVLRPKEEPELINTIKWVNLYQVQSTINDNSFSSCYKLNKDISFQYTLLPPKEGQVMSTTYITFYGYYGSPSPNGMWRAKTKTNSIKNFFKKLSLKEWFDKKFQRENYGNDYSFIIVNGNQNKEATVVLFGAAIFLDHNKTNFGSDEGVVVKPFNDVSYFQMLHETYRNIARIRVQCGNPEQIIQPITCVSTNTQGQSYTFPINMIDAVGKYQYQDTIASTNTKINITKDVYLQFKMLEGKSPIIFTIYTKPETPITTFFKRLGLFLKDFKKKIFTRKARNTAREEFLSVLN